MDMNSMINQELINLAIVCVTGFVGWVTKEIAGYLSKKGMVAQLESHKDLVKVVVNGVEQVYSQLHGKEKLNMAKIELIKLADARGIKLDGGTLDMLIESAVKEMNNAVQVEIANVEASEPPQSK